MAWPRTNQPRAIRTAYLVVPNGLIASVSSYLRNRSCGMTAATVQRELMFGIFSGDPDAEVSWITSVEGFDNAKGRTQQLATEKPGPYFVWDWNSRQVLFRIDAAGKNKGADGLAYRSSVLTARRKA
jgi:hypothetical protein